MASTPSSSPHKPRRKPKKASTEAAGRPSSPTRVVPATGRGTTGASGGTTGVAHGRPAYPLAALLWSARGKGPVSQWESLPLILMAVGLFRWAAGLWGYSGK
jgi:alpha-1,3-glucosyltransferase